MMRFNYLSDAPPEVIERVRALRIAAELRTPLYAFVTACFVVLAWCALERQWISGSIHEEAVAAMRLERSRAAFAATKLVRANVEDLLALDARVRKIRLSGSRLAGRLADIGNRIPAQAWLTSIDRSNDGFELEGRAEGLNVLSRTVASLMSATAASSPTLVRAVKEDSANGLIRFTMRVAEKP
jgi:Tfp pilus assembly protein PilN